MNRIRIATSAVAVAFLVSLTTAVGLAQNAPSGNMQWADAQGSGAVLRAYATNNAAALMTVPAGQQLIVLGPANGGWVTVQAPRSFPLYVSAQYINRDGNTGTVNATTLNARIDADNGAHPLTQLSRGTTVSIVEDRGGWLKIVPPAGGELFVQASQISTTGPVRSGDLQTYLNGGERQAAPAPETSNTSNNSGNTAPSRGEIAAAEMEMLEDIAGRMSNLVAEAGQTTGDPEIMRAIESLATEAEQFAQACETAAAGEAMRIVMQLRDLHAGEQEEAAALAREESDADADAQPQNNSAERQRAEQRLLYRPSDEFVATGRITDGRDSAGNQVYILVDGDGNVLYRIRLSPSTQDVDLRALWHQSVSLRGRIVKIDGEPYPSIVCTAIVQR